MAQVQALLHAAQFDVKVAIDAFERHVFTRSSRGVVDFAKATHADPSLNRKSGERLGTFLEQKLAGFCAKIHGRADLMERSGISISKTFAGFCADNTSMNKNKQRESR